MQGKTVLVTGAAKRLGRATALALAEAGAHVVVHYRGSHEAADAVVREVRAHGVDAWTVQADLAQKDDVAGLVDAARDVTGRPLDALVNNASVFPSRTLDATTLEDLEAVTRVNAWAPLLIARDFAAQAPADARIVNLLDTALTGPPDVTRVPYHLSKHAFAQATRLLALALAPDVTVNAVAPGLVLPPEGEGDAYLERLHHRVPLRRHGRVADVTDAVLFLLASPFLTGQVVYVDGGEHLGRNLGE